MARIRAPRNDDALFILQLLRFLNGRLSRRANESADSTTSEHLVHARGERPAPGGRECDARASEWRFALCQNFRRADQGRCGGDSSHAARAGKCDRIFPPSNCRGARFAARARDLFSVGSRHRKRRTFSGGLGAGASRIACQRTPRANGATNKITPTQRIISGS